MAAHHCIQIIQRVVHDLLQFQDGRDILQATPTLESISVSIELAYRELVVLDLANELNNKQEETVDIVRRCLSDIRDLQDIYQASEVRGRYSVLSVYAGGVGRSQYDVPDIGDVVGEQIHCSSDIKYNVCFCQHYQKVEVCIGSFC